MKPDVCPNCGELVPDDARACPGCGADENTGWNDRAAEQHLGISDPDEFDHDEFVREEFGAPARRGLHPVWIVTGGFLLAALAWMFLR